MGMFDAFNVTSSGLTAQRYRMDIISQNVANANTTRTEKPNIILIQLESFFDSAEAEFFTTSKDPIPTFHSLMKNYSSGYFKVPSVGAGTANTEFEVLTGMNLRYFGPGEYPYKTLLKYEKNCCCCNDSDCFNCLRDFLFLFYKKHREYLCRFGPDR